uniref:Uncharacterized protein n=1 Tax=Anguilla anguilla TaxID=7936 RepID=A0A0E9R491_ANGAN
MVVLRDLCAKDFKGNWDIHCNNQSINPNNMFVWTHYAFKILNEE